jgi:hypothetical protein
MKAGRALFLGLFAWVAGCGSSSANWLADGGDGGAADPGLDAATPAESGDGPATVLFGGTVYRLKSEVGIVGAEVCPIGQEHSACELTDSVGRFRFTMPAESNQAVTISAPGFGGIVLALRTGRVDLTSFSVGLASASDEKAYYARAGIEWPSSSSAFLFIFARDDLGMSMAGVTSVLSPASGSGPLYDDDMGVADKTLQATSTTGTVHFAGIGPGTIDVDFGPSSVLCSSFVGGWPSASGNAVEVPAVAGFQTLLGVSCF